MQFSVISGRPTKLHLRQTINRLHDIINNPAKFKQLRKPTPEHKSASILLQLLQGVMDSDTSSSQASPVKKALFDADFCAQEVPGGRQHKFTLNTMKLIVGLRSGPNPRSHEKIKKTYPHYRQQYLNHFKQCIARGESKSALKEIINIEVGKRFKEARANFLPVRGFMLQDWATQEALRLNATHFRAGRKWLWSFKQRFRVVSRKVTKFVGRAERAKQAQIDANFDLFQRNYTRYKHYFRERLIWNTDQTGFNYEQSTARTLSFKGERDTWVTVESKNKATHSYTAQPIISRDGKAIGKLTLCMQEKNGEFGKRVEPAVRRAEEEYGNIKVYASSSGKMDSNLMTRWTNEVLIPAARSHTDPSDGDTDDEGYQPADPPQLQPIEDLMRPGRLGMDEVDHQCYEEREREGLISCDHEILEDPQFANTEACRQVMWNRVGNECLSKPTLLLFMDAWGGNRAVQVAARAEKIKIVTIPEGSTAHIQPLDVVFNRQYKIFINRITEQAIHEQIIGLITARDGIINMHSLVWNQFSAKAYTDLHRYAWHNTDPRFEREELVLDPPNTVRKIQFNFPRGTCEVDDCTKDAFIRCAHCGKQMCLLHFLTRTCFHVDAPDFNETDFYHGRTSDDEMEVDGEYDELDILDEGYLPLSNLPTEQNLPLANSGGRDCL